MDITFDPEADAAYISLRGSESTYSHMVALDPASAGGMINFDFDTDGFLMGVEILGARLLLHPDVLRACGGSAASQNGQQPE